MTRIADRKSRLSFSTEEVVRYRGKLREIVVEVNQDGYGFAVRLKGTRVRLDASWRGVYDHAAKLTADRERAERKQRRRGLAA